MKFFDEPRFWYGADYNPEQWRATPEILDEDIRLMKLAHLNIVAVGIFSWSDLEPEEGVFDFSWLDTVMDKLAAAGISAALATPSAAPPAWLVKKEPTVLRVDAWGRRHPFGLRQRHCLTSPIYRQYVSRINRELAARYADHPALALWHVSNEYSDCCHCEQCLAAFRRWLRRKYHDSLDELNQAWWGSFWSHRYSDWDQILSPTPMGDDLMSGQKLDWKRFVSDQTVDFFENEIAPLRELTPDIPVTTNFMNTYDGLNYQEFARHLDVASWDNYPAWHSGDNGAVARETAFIHDLYRGMRDGQPFLVMESTPSAVNWHSVNKLQRPGMLTLSALQGIAHGSDSMQFFQWRKGRGSHEKYHGAVVDHVGHENTRVFREVAELGCLLSRLSGDLAGTRRKAQAAILYDWENEWGIRGAVGYNNDHWDYLAACQRYYAPLWEAGVTTDIIGEEQEFSAYRLIVAPMLYMLKPGVAKRLSDFVRQGGTLVGTYMSGMADENDLCFLGGFPGDGLRQVFGIWDEETDALYEHDRQSVRFGDSSYPARRLCALIHAEGADVLGTYEEDFYAGMPAVTKNTYGAGRAYYVAFCDDGAFARRLIGDLIREMGLRRPLEVTLPRDVTVQERGGRLFLMNFGETAATVSLPGAFEDALTGGEAAGEISLSPFGFRILKKREK